MLLECWTKLQRQQLQDEEVSRIGGERASRLRKLLRQLQRRAEFADLTQKELLTAHFLIQTRSFYVNILGRHDEGRSTQAVTHAVLVPVLDMLNTDAPDRLNAHEQLMYGQTSHKPEAIRVVATVRRSIAPAVHAAGAARALTWAVDGRRTSLEAPRSCSTTAPRARQWCNDSSPLVS